MKNIKGEIRAPSNSITKNQLKGKGADEGSQVGDDADRICQAEIQHIQTHWFLLENDFVDAISKGNYSLIPAATARVNFLLKVVNHDLLQEGLKGEEDALMEIHRFLHNNGWWVKASNLSIHSNEFSSEGTPIQEPFLVDFINSKADLVHPNTRIKVLQGDREGIRMALNQIHYGSLPKKGKDWKKHLDVICNFLSEFKNLIEPSIFRDAVNGDDKALSFALGQIHHRTLPPKGPEVCENNQASYRDTLNLNRNPSQASSCRSPSKSGHYAKKAKETHTIFFSGFHESTQPKEVWQFFKRNGRIKDIILPRKKDKYGNKFGFIIMESRGEAEQLIKDLNATMMGPNKMYLAMAKGIRKSPSQEPHESHSFSPKISKGQSPPLKDKVSSPIGPHEKLGSVVPPTPENVASMNILPNEDMVNVLRNSLLLKTVKNETVENVEMIAEGLRAKNGKFRGISGTTFLAYFEDEDDFKHIDIDFLKLGFEDVRSAQVEDFIPPRKVWIELRGLPIVGWTEENFSSLVQDYGHILHFCKICDSDGFYRIPKLLIETHQLEEINVFKYVNLLGKTWKLNIKETSGDLSSLNFREDSAISSADDKDQPFVSPMHDGRVNSPVILDEVKDSPKANFRGTDSVQDYEENSQSPRHARTPSGKIDAESNHEEVSTQSLVNPTTPRPSQQLEDLEDRVVRQAIQTNNSNSDVESESELMLNTACWKPREALSSSTVVHNLSSKENSVGDDDPLDQELSHAESQLSILKDLEKLKVKSRRGRPRKSDPSKINKHFKVPKRKKTRGGGLQEITHLFLNNTFDEAESIYETGLMMGLHPLSSREESLISIRQNLAC